MIRGGGSNSKLGAQNHFEAKKVGAQNLHFLYLRLKKWVRKCAPLRIRLHRPCTKGPLELLQWKGHVHN